MKQILLILALQLATLLIYAQKVDPNSISRRVPIIEMNNTTNYSGFTIQLISKNLDRYSFDILTGTKTLAHHFQDPLPFSPKGIQKKEDAYKIAQWMINRYKKTGHWENMMPPHVAQQLEIKCD
jgi:hypothetical protein